MNFIGAYLIVYSNKSNENKYKKFELRARDPTIQNFNRKIILLKYFDVTKSGVNIVSHSSGNPSE